jgi:hypothetical protein
MTSKRRWWSARAFAIFVAESSWFTPTPIEAIDSATIAATKTAPAAQA